MRIKRIIAALAASLTVLGGLAFVAAPAAHASNPSFGAYTQASIWAPDSSHIQAQAYQSVTGGLYGHTCYLDALIVRGDNGQWIAYASTGPYDCTSHAYAEAVFPGRVSTCTYGEAVLYDATTSQYLDVNNTDCVYF